MIVLLFPFAISLHNLEEAIWLPGWSKSASQFHKPVEKRVFYFAVGVITILAYLATFLYMMFPGIDIYNYIFFGFLGAMILNAFFPHLAATIVLKKYCPGTVTGLVLLVPINSVIIYTAIKQNIINFIEIGISTLIIGLILLGLLPILFKIGKYITSR